MLRIIGTFVLIYIAFRIITGLIIPWLLKRQLNKFKNKYHEQNQSQRRHSGKYRKGNVNISMDEKGKRKFDSDNIGEYVDFEEIDNNNQKKDKDK